MFKILDGRNYFYQWDIDRQIIVNDPTITEVHFCNRTDVCSLVVEVKDGIANVPNKVLQSGFKVRVFGYDGKATLHEATFEVKARTKPFDYVYTETEIKHYEDLERRLDKIEAEGFDEEVVNKAVSNYLEENPDILDGYYTKEEVENLIPEIPTNVSELNNDKEYISINDRVNNPRNAASLLFLSHFKDNQVGPTNRVNTFTKQLVTAGIVRWMGSDNTRYESYSNNITGWYKCNSDGTFSEYAVGKEPNVLKQGYYYVGYSAILYEFESFELLKTALSNSIVYDNSTSGLTATTVVEAINELSARPTVSPADLNNYYTKEETETYVDEAIENIEIPEVNLSNYYTKDEVNRLIPDTSSFITEVPAEYITETELINKGYLTEHQSLANYYTKDETTQAIQNAINAIGNAEGGAY